MLVDQSRLIADHIVRTMALLERESLIEREAQGAVDHVDAARQQIGLEGRRVLDRLDRDRVEDGCLAPPVGISLEPDGAAGLDGGDPIGTEGEARIGRLGVEAGAVAVGGRILLEDRPLEMGRQQPEIVDGVVVEGQLLVVDRESAVVDDVDLPEPPIHLGIAHTGLGVPSDLPGEHDVLGRHGRSVGPGGVGLDGVGEGHTRLAVGRGLANGLAVLEGRQLGAEHADQFPLLVERRQRPLRQAQHVALRRHRFDVGMEVRGELADADRQVTGPRRRRGQQPCDTGHQPPHHPAPALSQPAARMGVRTAADKPMPVR